MAAPDTLTYSFDLKENMLYAGERQIPAYELEANEIGTCGNCESIIISLSYHEADGEFIVVGKCTNCGLLSANIYDPDWNWVSEISISHFSRQITEVNSDNFSKIPGSLQ